MKQSILLLPIFFLFYFHCLSQDLSIRDLTTLCTTDNLVDVYKFLDDKKWKYDRDEEIEVNNSEEHVWYKSYSAKESLFSRFLFVYTKDKQTCRIKYEIETLKNFEQALAQLEKSDFKRDTVYVENKVKTILYSNNLFYVEVESVYDDLNYYIDPFFTYFVTIIKKHSPLDRRNGPQIDYDTDGSLLAKYNTQNGLKEGPFTVFYPDGSKRRTGAYKNDKNQGAFVEYDQNGSITDEYSFINGLPHGIEKNYVNNKLVRSVVWKNGIQDGDLLTYEYSKEDGKLLSRTIMEVRNNQPNGKHIGISVGSDGIEREKYLYHYVDNVKHGPFYLYNFDTIIVGNFKSGHLSGEYKSYCDVNKIASKSFASMDYSKYALIERGSFTKGQNDGKFVLYYLDGSIKEEFVFVDGKLEGRCVYYYKNKLDKSGKKLPDTHTVAKVEHYRGGKLNGPYESRDLHHQLISKGTYQDDRKEGMWIERDPGTSQNSTYKEGNFVNGFLSGEIVDSSYKDPGFIEIKE